MKRIVIWAMAVAAFAAAPSAALADSGGGGLYEPAPEPAAREQARAFIKTLPGGREIERRLTLSQLDNGVVLERSSSRQLPGTDGPAARRAGLGAGSEFVEGWPLALAAAAAVLAAAGWLARQRA